MKIDRLPTVATYFSRYRHNFQIDDGSIRIASGPAIATSGSLVVTGKVIPT